MKSRAFSSVALLTSIHFSTALPQLRSLALGNATAGRSLQVVSQCRSVALRLLPPAAVRNYTECFKEKMSVNSNHNWSVPGAEVDAQLQCWCEHDVTTAMQEYGCCDHQDIYPMCSVDCNTPDCTSALAVECIFTCPAMCLEAAEYVVDNNLCKNCNWIKCWPVLSCLVDQAKTGAESGQLDLTCHEPEFEARPELKAYQECWQYAPKHTSHWNVLSSIVYCMCREDMKTAATSTDCCDSVRYGGGVCNITCVPEGECASQVAQTCVHDCQRKCPALETAPSMECMQDCLSMGAPCRRYVACKPASAANYVCDDGRWPQANSGCCIDQDSGSVGCPLLCESEKLWRLDRREGAPQWARRHDGAGIIAMCTCTGCPSTSIDGQNTLESEAVQDGIWDNGQIILVDIARSENLKYGPNRLMQEIMVKRNEEILALIRDSPDGTNLDRKIAEINAKYMEEIIVAARTYPDRPHDKRERRDDNTTLIVVVVLCTIVVLAAFCVFALCFCGRRKAAQCSSPVRGFQQGEDVVVGQPVRDEERQTDPFSEDNGTLAAFGGTPVTVTAATKPKTVE